MRSGPNLWPGASSGTPPARGSLDIANPLGKGGAAGGAVRSPWTLQDEEMFRARKDAWKESEQMAKAAQTSEKQLADDRATMWKQVYDQIDKEQDDAIAAGAEYLKETEKLAGQTKQNDDFARRMGLTFSSAFENAVTHGKSLRDVLQGIGQDIAAIITRQTLTEPLGNAITQAVSGSGIGSWFSGLFSGGHAGGGVIPSGTWGTVGEQGPEAIFAGAGGALCWR